MAAHLTDRRDAGAAGDQPELMTVDELIVYLRLDVECTKPRTAVRNLIRRGRMPVLKLGRKWRFRKSAVDAWLAGETSGIRIKHPTRLVAKQ